MERDLTIWDSMVKAILDASRILLILGFELVLASLPVAARHNVRDQFVILAEL